AEPQPALPAARVIRADFLLALLRISWGRPSPEMARGEPGGTAPRMAALSPCGSLDPASGVAGSVRPLSRAASNERSVGPRSAVPGLPAVAGAQQGEVNEGRLRDAPSVGRLGIGCIA